MGGGRGRPRKHSTGGWARGLFPPASAALPPSLVCSDLPLRRSVRGLTLRLADVELTPAAQGRQAIGVALPLLLEAGLPSEVGSAVVVVEVDWLTESH